MSQIQILERKVPQIQQILERLSRVQIPFREQNYGYTGFGILDIDLKRVLDRFVSKKFRWWRIGKTRIKILFPAVIGTVELTLQIGDLGHLWTNIMQPHLSSELSSRARAPSPPHQGA